MGVKIPQPGRPHIVTFLEVIANDRLQGDQLRRISRPRTGYTGEGMLIGEDRSRESPTHLPHRDRRTASLELPSSHIGVARHGKYQKGARSQGVLLHMGFRQVEYGEVTKSPVLTMRKDRILEHRLIDTRNVVHSEQLERNVEPKQFLVTDAAARALNRGVKVILHHELKLWRQRVVCLIHCVICCCSSVGVG